MLAGWLSPAHAEPRGLNARSLTAAERQALLDGQRVERPLRFAARGGAYVGGIAYQLVRARPTDVFDALEDVERLEEILPRTQSARLLESSGLTSRIVLTQGAGPFLASYGLQLVRVPDRGELRFWLDPSTPRDIRDVWGFFRASPGPGGRTLVTVAIAVDLGPGLVKALFEDRVQALLLRSVSRLREAVEPPWLASGPSR